ncbi:MAG: haloacid dehalogenase [Planctomycetes bacterium]|jgi:phosphoserine phosphatase|nr:haloacid dehalogenase [Planctomycetota bacterium]
MTSVTDAPPPYATVVFDCDSTLSAVEGIEFLVETAADELAERVGTMTAAAMDGTLPLEEVYGARLELVRPSRADLTAVGAAYIERALPGGRELVAALLRLGKTVAIVSGGLRLPVVILAEHLGMELNEIHAVDTLHASDGGYLGFDQASPLARSGGKPEILRGLRSRHPGPLVLIGDGATDLEAATVSESPVSRFIAFGGVDRREGVFAAAEVTSEATDLTQLLPLLCTRQELGILGSG